MNTVKEHYDRQLASIYSWMAGDFDKAIERNRKLFKELKIETKSIALAVDLGCGSGFQSIALAELGFRVVAVDFCSVLLSELRDRANNLSIPTVNDNILNFSKHIDERVKIIVCMGDTLTHLEGSVAVEALFVDVEKSLAKNGMLILTFRDYVSTELQGTKRFIPVKSNNSRILTCFLEYRDRYVEVHDLLYEKAAEQWSFKISSYQKQRHRS